jgi:uncharacterized membrane protein YbhN (UPF0104 family)
MHSKKIGKRVLQICLLLTILSFFCYYMVRDWKTLTAYTFQWNASLLLVALLGFLGFLLQELSYGLIWRAVLARLGWRLDLRVCLLIYLASEFVRYIPGNVWHVLTRLLWVGKYGVSRPVAFASMTIELVTKLAAGALVFAISLLFWSNSTALHFLLHGTVLFWLLGVGSIFALLLGLHPRVLNSLLNVALRLLKRHPVVFTLRYTDILLITLMWCASWFVAGCAFYILLLALVPSLPLAALPICIGIYAIAWDIGFVSFVTPSGLGFREGAIAILLSLALPSLPLAVGPILAALSRVVSTLAEFVCVTIAYLAGGRQLPQAENMTLIPESEPEGKVDSVTNFPSHVAVERGVMSD